MECHPAIRAAEPPGTSAVAGARQRTAAPKAHLAGAATFTNRRVPGRHAFAGAKRIVHHGPVPVVCCSSRALTPFMTVSANAFRSLRLWCRASSRSASVMHDAGVRLGPVSCPGTWWLSTRADGSAGHQRQVRHDAGRGSLARPCRPFRGWQNSSRAYCQARVDLLRSTPGAWPTAFGMLASLSVSWMSW